MEYKECEGCNMLTLYDDVTICPMCLWEQESCDAIANKESHKVNTSIT